MSKHEHLNKIASAFLAAALAATLAPAPAASAAVTAAGSGALSAQAAPAKAAQAQAQAKKKAISKKMVTVKDLAYTGKALKPKVTVKSGKKTLKAGRDYTLVVKTSKGKKCSGNKVKAKGAYKAVVKGKGSYKGAVTKSFKVVAKKQAKVKLTASMVSVKDLTKAIGNDAYSDSCPFAYHDWDHKWDGQTAPVTVKCKGKTLKRGTDYTVKVAYDEVFGEGISGSVYAARLRTVSDKVWEPYSYVAYVTGKGAYTGTICKAFKLAPETKTVNGKKYVKQSMRKTEDVQVSYEETYYDWCLGCERTRTVTGVQSKTVWKDRWVQYDVEAMMAYSKKAERQTMLAGDSALPVLPISK